MHPECMKELETRIKAMRKEKAAYFKRCSRLHGYDAPGEMRGYANVLDLICPNPMED